MEKKINQAKIYIIASFLLILTLSIFGQSPQEIFKANRPAVCLVKFYKNVSSNSQIGSFTKIKQNRIGLLVNPKGLVMVSNDVYPLSLDIVSGGRGSFFSGEPTDFKVKLSNGKEYEAEFVGKDDLAEVAFVQIKDSVAEDLPFIEFSPTDDIQIGQPIYLMELLGENQNFEPLFTPVTVNAILTVPRKKILVNHYQNAMSSGGLVLTGDGKAIGITLPSADNFSFHDPMSFEEPAGNYLEVAPTEWFEDLVKNPPVLSKDVYRGKSWLGIRMQAITKELNEYWKVPGEGGVVIDQVYSQSPADKAGLKTRDIILSFNGDELKMNKDEDLDQFRELITQQPPNTKIKLGIFRDGKQLEKEVRLDAAPKAIDLAEKYQLIPLGFEVRELTHDILYDYNLPLNTEGVYVYQVDRAAPAGIGGLTIGSIISEVDYHRVKDLASFKDIMEKILSGNPKKIMFQVQVRLVTEFVFVDVK
jgi:serine protease Do